MKITSKFTLVFIIGVVLVHTAAAVLRIHRERMLFDTNSSRDSRILGRALGHAVRQIWELRGQADALGFVEQVNVKESNVQIRWVWLDGTVDEPHRPRATQDTLKPLGSGQSALVWKDEKSGSIYTYEWVPTPGQHAGAIEIGDSLVDEQDYLDRSVFNAAASALLLVAFCAVLAVVLGIRFIGRPIERLVGQARAIGKGDFEQRSCVASKDEIGELAVEMNHMADNLEQARRQLDEETRKRFVANEQLLHADRLSSLGTMASGIAHELGTPLNVIEGYAQIIREDSSVGAGVKENSQLITRQCKRMTTIIQRLLDFSRHGTEEGAAANACDAVRETLKMIEPLARKQKIEPHFEESGDEWVALSFGKLQQVLVNLVVNAIQAMPGGGSLRMSVGHCLASKPGNAWETEHVVIAVEDTGEGMAPDIVAKVFDPFFTTRDVGEGTGLGLYIAFGIVKDHDGWMEVKSEQGRGSTFTVFLPPKRLA